MKIKNFSLIYTLIIFSFLLFSCDSKVGYVKDDFKSTIEFVRIDQVLFNSYPNHLKNLNDSMLENYGGIYSFYFQNILNEGSPFTLKANDDLAFFLKHPHIRKIEDDIQASFKNISILESDIVSGFNYYNSLFNTSYQPTIATINSAGNYGIFINDSIIYIGLDMYVGSNKISVKDNAAYPEYIKSKMDKKYLTSDLFLNIIADNYYQEPDQHNFLSVIISYGKLMAILQRVLPNNSPDILLKYSNADYSWVESHQYSIWEFIVKNKMLFSNDNSIINGWVNEAPFTSSLGSESPSRIGVYLGWKIVEDYIYANDISIQELLNTHDNKKILASFKPKK